MALTVKQIEAFKPKKTEVRIPDGDGLYLHVTPKGTKIWKVRYFFDRKEQTLTIGKYPIMTLANAREELMEIKKKVAGGINPSAEKKVRKIAPEIEGGDTFEKYALTWLETKKGWSKGTKFRNQRRLEMYIFPKLGAKHISQITEDELQDALMVLHEKKISETMHRTRALIDDIFSYARREIKELGNPAALIKRDLPSAIKGHYATITDPIEVGQLLAKIWGYEHRGTIEVVAALKLAAYSFNRPGVIANAEWKDINFNTGTWHTIADDMKRKRPHITPLSSQALEIILELHHHTGKGQWLFPGRSGKLPISTETLRRALQRLGYAAGDFTTHGFRHLATTLLYEQDYSREWIEMQMAHLERDSTVRVYNHAKYMPQRTRMMQEWADYLDDLRLDAHERIPYAILKHA